MSGGRNSCMGRPMHQMAAHSVGHMDEGRIPPGGGRWFARWVSATLAFLTGACANVTPLDRPSPTTGVGLRSRWTARGFGWAEALPQQSTAHDDLECSGHGRTGATRHSPGGLDFHLEDYPSGMWGGCKARAFAPPHPRGWGAFWRTWSCSGTPALPRTLPPRPTCTY